MVNNMYTVIFGRDTTQDTSWKMYFIQLLMKSIAGSLPILVALFVSNLVYVLKYAGLFGFLMCFFFPVVLQLRSQWVCRRVFYEQSLKDSGGIIYGHSSASNDNVQIQKSPEEVLPLLNGDGTSQSPSLLQDILQYMTTCYDNRRTLYITPYSNFYSYPMVVLVAGLLGLICLVLTVTSLFVPAQE